MSSIHLFEQFFQAWLISQHDYLNQFPCLSSSQNQGDLESLVGHFLSHYQHYYDAKSVATEENVFIFFSPPWFSSFERSFLWITGFKPALAFKILGKSIGSELSPKQVEKVENLRMVTNVMEKMLGDEMIRIQESVAGVQWTHILSRREGEVVDDGEVSQVVETSRDGLRNLVVNADILRMTTIKELVKVLSFEEAAKFLAAIAQLQLKVRAWGLKKDADRISSW